MSAPPLRLPAPPPFELWLVSLAGDAAQDARLLDDAQRRRAAGFAFERDRRRHVAAHAALRRLLGRRLGVAPEAIRIEADASGKPRVRGEPGCAFSLSHSGDRALVALAPDGDIGVDLEPLGQLRELDALAARCLCDQERIDLDATPEAERELAFLRAWTRKEACLKALGTGLRIEPSAVRTGFGAEGRRLQIDIQGGVYELMVHSLVPEPGWVAALACRAGGPKRGMSNPGTNLYSAR